MEAAVAVEEAAAVVQAAVVEAAPRQYTQVPVPVQAAVEAAVQAQGGSVLCGL